ncbi:MAG TPA: hypothetical protein VK968_14880 [Roseimicrobium sp.]|nr:hypothetical protein [Roseimicrobium sp.]
MKHLFTILSVVAGICVTSLNAADVIFTLPPESTKLKPGEGSDVVRQQCTLCHSVDYISTQPPLSRTTWTATLTKMQQKYGAPIPADRTQVLVDYLTLNYGNEATKPVAPSKK